MNSKDIQIKFVHSDTNTLPDGTWYYPQHGNAGWICPKCGRVNAPWVAQCPCTNNWSAPGVPYTPYYPYTYITAVRW